MESFDVQVDSYGSDDYGIDEPSPWSLLDSDDEFAGTYGSESLDVDDDLPYAAGSATEIDD